MADNAENIFDQIQPQTVSADELHALLLSIKEENATLRRQVLDLEKVKRKEEEGTVGMAGGAPVTHHLHLVDGRVVQSYEGIGTHYSETLEDGTERVTRINAHYPVEEIHPSKAYA
jgi:hypothetical protein